MRGGPAMPPPRKASRNRSMDEKISGAWASIEGNKVAEAVIKATDSEETRPKPKHLRVLLEVSCMKQRNCEKMIKCLAQRSQRSGETIVVLKTLATIHFIISKGGPTFRECIAVSTMIYPLLGYELMRTESSQGFNAWVIQTYAKYIEERRSILLDGVFDYAQNVRSSEYFKKIVTNQLFKEIEAIQRILNLAIFFESENEFENQLLVFILVTITDDVARLFASLSDAIIVVLETFFEMGLRDAKRALTLYESFVANSQKIENFLAIVKAVVRDDAVPEFRSTRSHSVSLMQKLKNYVSDTENGKAPNLDTIPMATLEFSQSPGATVEIVPNGGRAGGRQAGQTRTDVSQDQNVIGEVLSAPPESSRRRRVTSQRTGSPLDTPRTNDFAGGSASGQNKVNALTAARPQQQAHADPFASPAFIGEGTGINGHMNKRNSDLFDVQTSTGTALGVLDAKSLSMDVFDPLSSTYEHETRQFSALTNGQGQGLALGDANAVNYNISTGMRGQGLGTQQQQAQNTVGVHRNQMQMQLMQQNIGGISSINGGHTLQGYGMQHQQGTINQQGMQQHGMMVQGMPLQQGMTQQGIMGQQTMSGESRNSPQQREKAVIDLLM